MIANTPPSVVYNRANLSILNNFFAKIELHLFLSFS